MPAPLANKNATRHGLTAGGLPTGCTYITKTCNVFRRQLEVAVAAMHGEIDLAAASAINTATRWERHAQLCQRWLKTEPDLSPADKLAFSRDVGRASSERDKAIKSLGLEGSQDRDPWRALQLPQQPHDGPDDDPHPQQPQNGHAASCDLRDLIDDSPEVSTMLGTP